MTECFAQLVLKGTNALNMKVIKIMQRWKEWKQKIDNLYEPNRCITMELIVLDYASGRAYIFPMTKPLQNEQIEAFIQSQDFNLDEVEWMTSAERQNLEIVRLDTEVK